MEYRYWRDRDNQVPCVLQALKTIESADANSAKWYRKHLEKLRKYSYLDLVKHKVIKKLKGKNPWKIHELRFFLPRKIARTFFVVARDSSIWLLHLIIKKKDQTPKKDIQIAEQRAMELNDEISYL